MDNVDSTTVVVVVTWSWPVAKQVQNPTQDSDLTIYLYCFCLSSVLCTYIHHIIKPLQFIYLENYVKTDSYSSLDSS